MVISLTTLLTVDFANLTLGDSLETTSARRLARKSCIEHIGSALPDKVELHVFPTFNCPAFESYLAKALV